MCGPSATPFSIEHRLAPVLKNDSLLVILDGDAQDVWSSANRAQTSRLGFGEVSWLRRDDENFIR